MMHPRSTPSFILLLPAVFLLCGCGGGSCPSPGVSHGSDSPFKTEYLQPVRIVLEGGMVDNPGHLIPKGRGQVSTSEGEVTRFSPGGFVLLDFGREIQGGLQIARAMGGDKKAALFRVTLGESVSEALSDLSEKGTTATNEHSVRDFEMAVPWLGTSEVGDSGFRFARVELLDFSEDVPVVSIRAKSVMRDLPYRGSFRCSDPLLDSIWKTGAYTVQLCMQDFLWDGIKRDRLVWIGDMHPEVMTVGAVFGEQETVRRSLDFVRDETPASGWMNGIPAYSLWWILIHHQLYRWYADKEYLLEQKEYLRGLLTHVLSSINGDSEAYQGGMRFIDWPSYDNPDVVHAGLQALSVMALEAGAEMTSLIGEGDLSAKCSAVAKTLRTNVPDPVGNSQAAALLCIAGMLDPQIASSIIIENGPSKLTSFMGYYILEALSRGGRYEEAMTFISKYWGLMLELGATTFWEDFNYGNGLVAARIDEVVPEGKFDIHKDGGAWCYVGLRRSLCHGWASGPTPWLSRHVLGIEPVGEGLREVRIEPHLGPLQWAEGTFPTPYGDIAVSHRRNPDGSVSSKVTLPRGVRRVK